MFEHRHAPLISGKAFARRMVCWVLLTLLLILVSLLVGVAGYHYLEGLPWLDSLENAAMILGGMGPVSPLLQPEAKWFASIYAIYCGIFLVCCGGVLLVPIFHRVLHHFHMESSNEK